MSTPRKNPRSRGARDAGDQRGGRGRPAPRGERGDTQRSGRSQGGGAPKGRGGAANAKGDAPKGRRDTNPRGGPRGRGDAPKRDERPAARGGAKRDDQPAGRGGAKRDDRSGPRGGDRREGREKPRESWGGPRRSGGGPAPRDFREQRGAGGRDRQRAAPKKRGGENELSKAARERLAALRAEYDPSDDERQDPDRDSYPDVPGGIRLQKALAQAGVASRRASEEMIAAGRVTVDGHLVRRFGARVDPTSSEIRVDGMLVATAPDLLYYALNKPRGVVSTMWDPEGRPTLSDYVGETEERLFHVGRLDTETEGLILLTNDGELTNRLTHPRYNISKTYIAKVPGPVPREVIREIRQGVELEDGPVTVDSFRVVENQEPKALVEVRLHEGRKHVVRRMLEAVGYPVSDLARTQVGPIGLHSLKQGTMRALTAQEVSELYTAAGM